MFSGRLIGLRTTGHLGGPPCRDGGTLTARRKKKGLAILHQFFFFSDKVGIERLEVKREREKSGCHALAEWSFLGALTGFEASWNWLHRRQLWHLSIVHWLPSRDRALVSRRFSFFGFFLFRALLLSHCNIVRLQPICTCLPAVY